MRPRAISPSTASSDLTYLSRVNDVFVTLCSAVEKTVRGKANDKAVQLLGSVKDKIVGLKTQDQLELVLALIRQRDCPQLLKTLLAFNCPDSPENYNWRKDVMVNGRGGRGHVVSVKDGADQEIYYQHAMLLAASLNRIRCFNMLLKKSQGHIKEDVQQRLIYMSLNRKRLRSILYIKFIVRDERDHFDQLWQLAGREEPGQMHKHAVKYHARKIIALLHDHLFQAEYPDIKTSNFWEKPGQKGDRQKLENQSLIKDNSTQIQKR